MSGHTHARTHARPQAHAQARRHAGTHVCTRARALPRTHARTLTVGRSVGRSVGRKHARTRAVPRTYTHAHPLARTVQLRRAEDDLVFKKTTQFPPPIMICKPFCSQNLLCPDCREFNLDLTSDFMMQRLAEIASYSHVYTNHSHRIYRVFSVVFRPFPEKQLSQKNPPARSRLELVY